MTVQWWCAASQEPWTWTPQAYPGVWLFVAAIAAGYLGAVAQESRHRGAPAATPAEKAAFAAGLALTWLVLDWPIGPLAAGYLLSAHLLQYVILTLIATPLLEYAMPGWMRARLLRAPVLRWLAPVVARPALTFLLVNLVMVATHFPVVADTLKPLQLGSMAIDLLWFSTAFLFWWSVRGDARRMPPEVLYGRRFLYVLGMKIMPIFLGAFFSLAEFPLYATYELAPRVLPLSALGDQVVGGVLLWMGTTPVLIARLAMAFFAWHAAEAASGAGK